MRCTRTGAEPTCAGEVFVRLVVTPPGPEEEPVPFVNLHTHSEYSLLDGASRISEMVQFAKEQQQPAIAITDHGVLYGALELSAKAGAAGVKPIIGCEVYVARRSRKDREYALDRDPFHLILLARNLTGYRNLVSLVSRAHLEGYYYRPRIDRDLLVEKAEGLICLSACIGGELPQALVNGDTAGAERVARWYSELFGHDGYFLELQDHGIPEEEIIRAGLIDLSRKTGIPMVATGDSHYSHKEDAAAHEILLCLQTGARLSDEKRFRFAGPHFYLQSGREMQERFSQYGDAVSNSVAIAALCDLTIPIGVNHLPTYEPIPEGMDSDTYLEQLCREAIPWRYGNAPEAAVTERMEMELGVIRKTGFAAYILIVWDFIRAAREEGVRVGPGRGSAAGSIVCYLLGITDICPLRYGLIFERFLNVERVSMPDIDVDFDDRRRDRVVAYVQRKYGKERVAQIITFGTMAARAAIRDVGRVLDVPLADVDRWAKTVPQTVGITLEKALEDSPEFAELYEKDEAARRVIDIARRLEGICRNASTHAAGVVIAPEPLENLVPLQRPTADGPAPPVTMFDMNGVQRIGLLKMDFLGLGNLSIIGEALEKIEKSQGVRFDISSIPLDDPATYAMLGRGDTHGVFQMEASFAKRILMDMQPQTLEDLGVAGALNRPGPIESGVVDIYVRRKRGEEETTYPLPELEPILRESYGTILYQDQVMLIASAVAGYSLGEADILRAAMGKKDKDKMAHQREKFLAGATARGVSEQVAAELFDHLAYFAGYGFNKAHSVAYALITYQTAYLKAHFPIEYMAALLNSRAGDLDKIKQTIADCVAHRLVVCPPSVNHGESGFSVGMREKGEILYGLAHIKNVGAKVVEQLVAAREERPFTGLFDLCFRTGKELNRRALESLIKSGACDEFGNRTALLAVMDRTLERVASARRERDSGQASLFGDIQDVQEVAGHEEEQLPVTATAAQDALTWERELLGMYLSDHPIRRLGEQFEDRVDTNIGELGRHLDELIVQVGGLVRDMRAVVPRRSTTGQKMAFLTIEDMTGECEVVVFSRVFEECAAVLRPDAIVVVRGRVEMGSAAQGGAAAGADDAEVEKPKIIAEAVYGIDDPVLLAWQRHQVVHLNVKGVSGDAVGHLQRLLARHPGDARVVLHVVGSDRIDDLELSQEFSVRPGPQFEREVSQLLGPASYLVETERPRGAERASRRQAVRKPVTS